MVLEHKYGPMESLKVFRTQRKEMTIGGLQALGHRGHCLGTVKQ